MKRFEMPKVFLGQGIRKSTFPRCPKCSQLKLRENFIKNRWGKDEVFIACGFCGFHYTRDKVTGDKTW